MNKKIILTIFFNTFKWSPDRLTEPWIQNRLNLFFKYTLPSLKAQTFQDFITYVYCDIESMDIIEKQLAMREPLPDNIHFLDTNTIKERIKSDIQGYDLLYLVRIDSDNMYQKDYLETIYEYTPKPETEALITQYGYMFDDITKKLVPYYMESPSFYTFIYNVDDFLKNIRYKVPGGHAYVISTLKCELIPGQNYLISVHDDNVKFKSWRLNNLKEITNPTEVFHEFGVEEL